MPSNSNPYDSQNIQSLCVFCASSSALDEGYYAIGEKVGEIIAAHRIHLVYGGAAGGIMGRVADAVLKRGGKVTGVIPEVLSGQERQHAGLTKMYVTKDMHERQKKMADLSDAFLVLPGGLGTLAEFFEILTWKQIGLHKKPIWLLNSDGFWSPLLEQFRYCHRENFMYSEPELLFDIVEQIEEINDFFSNR